MYLSRPRNQETDLHGNLTVKSFLLILIAISLGSAGQICLKLGLGPNKIPVDRSSLINTLANFMRAVWDPYVISGLLFYVVSTFFYLMALSRVRLSVAYPLISMSYILVVILSAVLLKEHVTWKYASIGLLLISAGVTFIGLGLGQTGGR